MGATEVDHLRHDRVGGRRVLDERAAVAEAARTLNRLLTLIGRGGVANVGLGVGALVLVHQVGAGRPVGAADERRAAAGSTQRQIGPQVPLFQNALGRPIYETGISTVPAPVITGDLGLSPYAASAITMFSLIADSTNLFSTSAQVTGKIYASNYTAPTPANLTTAIGDMELADGLVDRGQAHGPIRGDPGLEHGRAAGPVGSDGRTPPFGGRRSPTSTSAILSRLPTCDWSPGRSYRA